VTTVSKTRDLTTLTTATLLEKIREHELEMNRLMDMEIVERKTISLAPKTNVIDEDNNEETFDECSDTENLNLLTKRL